MNRKKSVGIVLKKQFPRYQKISLLDQQFGRIEGIPASVHALARVAHGSLVEYTVAEERQAYFLHDMSLLDNLQGITDSNLLFFHHVLEMVYFGIPVDAQAEDLFHLLTLIQQHLSSICTRTSAQRIFLGKLLVLMGVEVPAPVEPILKEVLFQNDVGQLVAFPLDQTEEQILSTWIYAYIQNHPFAHMFKTIHFLNEVK